MPTIEKNRIVWDYRDWLAGIHPQSGEDYPSIFSGNDSLSNFNPFRRLGSALPGTSPSNLDPDDLIDGTIKRIVANTPYANNLSNAVWGWGAGGTKVYKIATSGNFSVQSSPHAITNSEMEDVGIYKVGSNESLFASYNKSGGGDITVYNNFSTWDDTYWTVTLSAAALNENVPHPLIVGDDDNLYIGDGNIVKADKAGTADESALVLPESYTIKGFAKFQNRTLVVFADQDTGSTAGSCRAFFWDYVAKDPYKILEIDGNTLGGAIEYKNSVGIFSIGLSGDEEENDRNFRFNWYNGNSFEPVYCIEATPNAQPEAPSFGGASVIGDYLLVNVGGKIWSYGSPFVGINAGPSMPYLATGSKSGALFRPARDTIISSSNTSSSFASGGLENLSTTTYGNGSITSSYAKLNLPITKNAKLKRVQIEFNTFTGTITNVAGLNVFLFDDNANYVQVLDGFKNIERDSTKLVYYPDGMPTVQFLDFDKIALSLSWDGGSDATKAPTVSRVLVEFEQVEIN